MRIGERWSISAVLVSLPLFPVQSDATAGIPGFAIETYTFVNGPLRLAFDDSGVLYIGRPGGLRRVWRVDVGGFPVTTFGAQIESPNAVVVDTTGSISGVPGAVIVGGTTSDGGTISAIRPIGSVVTLFGPSPSFVDPTDMAIDSSGRLIFTDFALNQVLVSAGGFPATLFTLPADAWYLAIGPGDEIFTSATDGRIRIHDSAGNLLNDAFGTGLGSNIPLAVGTGGVWGTNLYAITNGNLVRFDAPGLPVVLGNGFTDAHDLAFGPDGALYVSMRFENEVLRIAAIDCNGNGIADVCELSCGAPNEPCFDVAQCGTADDCNGNGVLDSCDVDGFGDPIALTEGLSAPEDIAVSEGTYPNGFFVPSAWKDVVYHVSPLGGTIDVFSTGLLNPIGAKFVPDEFGRIGERLFVINQSSPRVVTIDPTGIVGTFSDTPIGITFGLEYIPLSFGGPAAGHLIVTGADVFAGSKGRIVLVDSTGASKDMIAPPAPVFWTPTLAPAEFGMFGNQVLVGEGDGASLLALDLSTSDLTRFAAVPFTGGLKGLRQIAFSPPGWASSIDPALSNKRVLLLSVASGLRRGDAQTGGMVMAWDENGRLVAVMRKGPDGQIMEPRGLRFVEDDLLISDISFGRGALLRAAIADFSLPDCNENGVPDPCELDGGAADCNDNQVLDSCEPDCNTNGIADECDLDSGFSLDCNRNFNPDECDPDVDGDGFPDDCDQPGDFDHDADVDMEDYREFALCLSESGPFLPTPSAPCRDTFDLDGDSDVDLSDFTGLEKLLEGFPALSRIPDKPRNFAKSVTVE